MNVTITEELSALREENISLRKTIENMNEVLWAQMRERFHAFDAIKDERCPCCGAAVVIQETPNSVTLKSRSMY